MKGEIHLLLRCSQNVLELARLHSLQVFAPSTIAVFGPSTPRDLTPNTTVMEPTTMYGITKVSRAATENLQEVTDEFFGTGSVRDRNPPL